MREYCLTIRVNSHTIIEIHKTQKTHNVVAKKYYTTSEAARLLSVSSDTVLKWVRAGKIKSYRTPGGHARIPVEAINAILPDSKMAIRPVPQEELSPSFKYCWEFNSGIHGLNPECRECIAYLSRARRCYEIRSASGISLPPNSYCRDNCEYCEYYRLMYTHEKAVLIVSQGKEWLNAVVEQSRNYGMHVETAASEYECAMRVNAIRPDVVVVDCGYGAARTRQFCRHIREDERLPMVRIILASKVARIKDYCEDEIFGWISRPFTFDQLRAMIDGIEME